MSFDVSVDVIAGQGIKDEVIGVTYTFHPRTLAGKSFVIRTRTRLVGLVTPTMLRFGG